MSDEQTIEQSDESTNTTEVNNESTISQDSGEQNVVERPDWLPSKFETPEQLSVSYGELEKKFHTRRDEIKQELVGELNEEVQADVLSEFTNIQSTSGPDWNEESQDLGEHADRRLERVDTWANSTLSEDAYNMFAGIPATAGMVKAFEEIMQLNGQPKFNMTSPTEFQENVTKADLMSAQQDPKYWKNGGDPAHIQMVRAMSEQLSRKRG